MCELALDFAPWPQNLVHLGVEVHSLATGILTNSAQTLTSLHIASLHCCCLFHDLASVAPQLTSLTSLCIPSLPVGSFDVPDHFSRFAAALPVLDTLFLPSLTPLQVERILSHFTASSTLRCLRTALYMLNPDPEYAESADWDGYPDEDRERWTVGWVPALQRCAELPVMRPLERLMVSVVVTELCNSEDEYCVEANQFKKWKVTKPGWAQFVHTLKGAKVVLAVGPL